MGTRDYKFRLGQPIYFGMMTECLENENIKISMDRKMCTVDSYFNPKGVGGM